MFKAERFIREYASYQKKYVKEKAFFLQKNRRKMQLKRLIVLSNSDRLD